MKDYDGYNFKKFKELAKDSSISVYEKIGFPDNYRKGVEEKIFADILSKVPLIQEKKGLKVLDIGGGCSDLQRYVSDFCKKQDHALFSADSAEMLNLNKDEAHVIKVPGLFPKTAREIKEKSEGIDVVICYSVFHYIFVDSNVWYFIDCLLDLLNEGGQVIIGDIPNISKRKRFFASNNGIKFHQEFMKTTEKPLVEFNCIDEGKIDDSLLMSVILKCQASGFDAYVLPQHKELPFANRRDDLIIRKP